MRTLRFRPAAALRAIAVLMLLTGWTGAVGGTARATVLHRPMSRVSGRDGPGRNRVRQTPAAKAVQPNAFPSFQLYLPVPWGATIDASGPHFFCGSQCSSGAAVLNSVDLGYGGDETGTMPVEAAGTGVLHFHDDYGYPSGHLYHNCWASIDHSGGWRTTYYHLTNPVLSLNGTTVQAGQQIATDGYPDHNTCGVGNIGHVHFSLWQNPPTVGGANNGTPVAISGLSIGGYTVHGGAGTNCGYGSASGQYSYYGSWTRNSDGHTMIAGGCFERPSLVNNILKPTSITNGSFIQVSGHPEVYEVVGGAPLYVSNWANVGGQKSVATVSAAQFGALRPYPADGTAVYLGNPGPDHGAGFIFAGGAPMPVANWANVGNPSYLPVDLYALDHHAGQPGYAQPYPVDGTAVYVDNPGAGHGAGYIFAGGAPLPVANWANVGSPHITPVDAFALDHYSPIGGPHVRQEPTNGTAVYVGNPGPEHGAGFEFAGGAPLPVANWANIGSPHITPVDASALSHFGSGADQHAQQYPANGTAVYVANAGSGHGTGFVFAGGAPTPVQAWAHVGNPHLTGVDSYALTHPGADVLAAPANGTHLHGSASPKVFEVVNDVARFARRYTGPSVLVDQAELDDAGTRAALSDLHSSTPVVHLRGKSRRTHAKHATIRWHAPPAASAITSFALRREHGAHGSWSTPKHWSQLHAHRVVAHLPKGRTCFAVRATDRAGLRSHWTPPLCLTRS